MNTLQNGVCLAPRTVPRRGVTNPRHGGYKRRMNKAGNIVTLVPRIEPARWWASSKFYWMTECFYAIILTTVLMTKGLLKMADKEQLQKKKEEEGGFIKRDSFHIMSHLILTNIWKLLLSSFYGWETLRLISPPRISQVRKYGGRWKSGLFRFKIHVLSMLYEMVTVFLEILNLERKLSPCIPLLKMWWISLNGEDRKLKTHTRITVVS